MNRGEGNGVVAQRSEWLSPRTVADVELDPDLLGSALREYRRTHRINQADLAQILHVDQSYVSKIETGQRQVRDVGVLLRIAQQLDLPPERLGLSAQVTRPVPPPSTGALVGAVDPVGSNQADWRATRRRMNGGRGPLARTAAQLYQPEARLGRCPMLAPAHWVPEAPIPLDEVALEWTDAAAGAAVTGGEPEASCMLPLRASGQRYSRYSAAVRYLDPPSLFENRPSYRLLDLDLAGPAPRMRFGLGTYFDKLDVSEALAHELAMAGGAADGIVPPWSVLPMRGLVGDPFDLARRMIMPAIETLTVRRDRATGAASFLLHWRDPAKVATTTGVYGLIPAGEFQPSSIASTDRANDFDLWRNMVREFSEEILGEPERDGSSGEPLDYEGWSFFRDLRSARSAGQVAVHVLGVGLDALTLTATILTVAVFDADVFDELFGDAVSVNAEGRLVTTAGATKVTDGLPFDGETVRRLLSDEPMASPAACILDRTWRYRDVLLAGDS